MKRREAIQNVMILLGVIILGIGIVIFLNREKGEHTTENSTHSETEEETGTNEILSMRRNDYPRGVNLGDSLTELQFETKDKEPFFLSEKQGEYVVLTFWAGWCEQCKAQLEHMESFENVLKQYENVSFLLVNALDTEKESVEAAQSCLAERGITAQNVFDRDKKVYEKLGIQKIPTTLLLSPEGKVLADFTGKITSASAFESMLSYAINGYDHATLSFVTGILQNEAGGIKTGLDKKKEHPSGDDVLCESQGLLMEYAVAAKDQPLFDEAYAYAKKYLKKDGLFLWFESSNTDVTSNAFLDDLRIYGALLQAEELWGGYEAEITELEGALCQYNITKDGPIDYYDFKYRTKNSEFFLCYGDLETIKRLEERTGSRGLYKNTEGIINEGYISDTFPLYYSSWSYKKKEYSIEELNMAENVYILYHLAKAGLLKEESEAWLMEQLRGNGIMAGYQTDGSVTDGYGYESTAIYALTAMIGMECDNSEMVTLSISRMNRFRIFDSQSQYDGAFGNADGTGIYSFDQCLALKAYGLLEDYIKGMENE